MRATQKAEMLLGQIAIENIELDARCRDDVPAVLKGIQYIYCKEELRQEIFTLLENHILEKLDPAGDSPEAGRINRAVGRRGMDLWNILVLGLLKQGINCDYDRLHDLANRHLDVRRMLGLSEVFDSTTYSYRTLSRNVALLTPELLAAVNRLVVGAGHELVGHRPPEPLQARCDSFTVETDVHYPTDVSLLWDALRCLIRVVARACQQHNISGWRQSMHLTMNVRNLFNRVRSWRQRQGKPKRVQAYLRLARDLSQRARATLEQLAAADADADVQEEIKCYLEHTERQIDQIDRRILQGEVIPHEEKVFSIFEPHTRWCAKGKAGRAVELGVPVSVVESEHQFILHHKIQWAEHDVEVAQPLVAQTQALYPSLAGCSFDKGYHSRANREQLDTMLKVNALPQKGRLSKMVLLREAVPAFVAARRAHAAVESAINNLECRGLNRVRAHGADGFERMVGLSVLSTNFHRIGLILQHKERERLKLQCLRRAA